MVVVGTGKSGTRFIKTDYPIEEGLVAGVNKLREKAHLEPEEDDLTNSNNQVGL